MKKTFLFFIMVVLIRPSYGQNECGCNITVYGDIHLTAKTDSVEKMIVYRVQQWLYSIVKEEFVVVEGFSQFGPITRNTLLISTISEIKKIKRINPNKDSVLEYLKKGAEFNVKKRFILEGEKKVFGGEDDSLHKSFILTPDLASLPKNLDLRSEAILKNTFKVCKIFSPNNIAIIIGIYHLKWFKDRGYKVVEPHVFIGEYFLKINSVTKIKL